MPSVSPAFGVHAVLWRHGTVTALAVPPLRGNMSNAALAINNRGQVVSASNLPLDSAPHAFFCENGVLTDPGTLSGATNSTANDINNKGHVVGVSCDATFTVCRAILWDKGVITDLNPLTPPGSALFLTYGAGINDGGEIAGSACDQTTGTSPVFLAIICDARHADDEECQKGGDDRIAARRPHAVLPETVGEQLRWRLRFPGYGD